MVVPNFTPPALMAPMIVIVRAGHDERRRSDELAVLIQGIALANPELSLRGIARQLQAMRVNTPYGKTHWSPKSVSHLLSGMTRPVEDLFSHQTGIQT